MDSELATADGQEVVPKYADMIPTEGHLLELRAKHPHEAESKIVWRAKMSMLATARHKYDRNPDGSPRFGGAQKGSGRPPKRMGKAFLDWADDNQKDILGALGTSLKEGDSQQRGKKALDIIKSVREEMKIEIKERKYDGMTKDDLATAFVKSFAQKIREKDPAVKDLALALQKAIVDESETIDV